MPKQMRHTRVKKRVDQLLKQVLRGFRKYIKDMFMLAYPTTCYFVVDKTLRDRT
jgi:hypothetical protein